MLKKKTFMLPMLGNSYKMCETLIFGHICSWYGNTIDEGK